MSCSGGDAVPVKFFDNRFHTVAAAGFTKDGRQMRLDHTFADEVIAG